ncbi:DNA-binding protein [Nostoc sp. CHAB 5834]|nr:DNA-binding protein [Nostoc sp. CHAB 5834]
MSRSTSTRAKVRAIADQIASQGGDPTPTLVRSLLGGGSPNTIVDELRSWKAARDSSGTTPSGPKPLVPPPPMASRETVEKMGLAELASALQTASEVVARQEQGISTQVALQAELAKMVRDTEKALELVPALLLELKAQRTWMEESLSKLEARAEGTQRYLLRSLDESREETRIWKERAKAAADDGSTWRNTLQRRVEQLLEERGRLIEKQSHQQ